MRKFLYLLPIFIIICSGCGVYSLSGANIEGKTINMHVLDNRARNVVPSLTATITDKIRNRILSQTGLAPLNSAAADYDVSGAITGYEVTVSALQNTQTATKNRLTITLSITFKNKLNEKNNFEQSFTRFSDFDASQTLQNVERTLIDDIGNQLADDIFNKAFVNW